MSTYALGMHKHPWRSIFLKQTVLTQLMWQLLMEHGQRHSDIVMYDLDEKSLQPMCSKLLSDLCMVFAGHVSICKGSKSYKICFYKGVFFLSTDVRSTHWQLRWLFQRGRCRWWTNQHPESKNCHPPVHMEANHCFSISCRAAKNGIPTTWHSCLMIMMMQTMQTSLALAARSRLQCRACCRGLNIYRQVWCGANTARYKRWCSRCNTQKQNKRQRVIDAKSEG